jgi:hypothetical protein
LSRRAGNERRDHQFPGAADPEQALVDRLAIAFFALAELLGVTEFAEALL